MSDDASRDDDSRPREAVGYGRAPVHSRFQKGRSGNPRGRQKGVSNFLTDLKQSLEIPVSVNEKGKPKRISTQKALLLRAREKALKGDNRALENFLNLARMHNTTDAATMAAPGSDYDLTRLSDQELNELDRLLAKASPLGSDPSP